MLYFSHHGVEIHQGDTLAVLSDCAPDCIDLIATSPPYNCRKDYGDVVDEVAWPDYYEYMGQVLDQCYRILVPGGVLAINVPSSVRFQHDHVYRHTWRDFDPDYKGHRGGEPVEGRGRIEPLGNTLMQMMWERDRHVRESIVWVKGPDGAAYCPSSAMGSDNNPYLRPAHELILLGSKDHWHHRGGTGRRGPEAVPFDEYTKDVWHIQPVSNPNHPAVWPDEIPRRLILLFVHAEDATILDPFMGSGTTLGVAQKLGYRAIGIDANPAYCEAAAQRFSQGVLF